MTGKLVRFLFFILVAVSIFVFPRNVRADAGYEEPLLIYYSSPKTDNEGKYVFVPKKLILCGRFTSQNKAHIIYANLFEVYDKKNAPCIPENTKLLEARIDDGLLTLNVSRGIKNYGGSAYEIELVRQIMRNAAEIEGVTRVTLLIEGIEDYLPEGTQLINTDIGDISNDF